MIRRIEKEHTTLTREQLIEIYEAELHKAFDDLGDDFDLCRDDVDFTEEGAMIWGQAALLPLGTIDLEHMSVYLS